VSDPVRIREGGADVPDELRDLFRAAPRPEPMMPAVQALLSTRVATLATAPTSLLAKALPWLLGGTVAVAGAAGLRARRAEPHAPPQRPPSAAPAPEQAREPVPPVEVAPALAPPAAAPAARAGATPAAKTPRVSELDGLVGEERLLNEAHQALAASPRKALALAQSHARRYPRGQLAAERELITIEALLQLGRRHEAEARGRDLRRIAPNSIYEERLDEILRQR